MLKPVLYTFLNFFYIDNLIINGLYQFGAFMWDYYFTKDDFREFLGKTIGIHIAQYAVGFAIAQLFRLVQRRFSLKSRKLFTLDLDHARPLIVAVLAFFALVFYQNKIHDAFYKIADPFPIGPIRALLWYIGVLGIVEMYEHTM